MKTCVVVFGDGSASFIEAAQRLGRQAESLRIFEKVFVFNSESLSHFSKRYRDALPKIVTLTEFPLYFRAIKPWAILAAMEHQDNYFDVVFYIDAGCEIPNNSISKLRMKSLIRDTFTHGAIAEETGYLESAYSRRNLIDFFGSRASADARGQIQSTWSMFRNDKRSREFMLQWILLSEPRLNFWQDPNRENLVNEFPHFIEHRRDQSIFSLLYKKYQFPTRTTFWEYGGKFGRLRGVSIPIHATRNKTGVSNLPTYQTSSFVAFYSLILNSLIDKLRPLKNRVVLKISKQ